MHVCASLTCNLFLEVFIFNVVIDIFAWKSFVKGVICSIIVLHPHCAHILVNVFLYMWVSWSQAVCYEELVIRYFVSGKLTILKCLNYVRWSWKRTVSNVNFDELSDKPSCKDKECDHGCYATTWCCKGWRLLVGRQYWLGIPVSSLPERLCFSGVHFSNVLFKFITNSLLYY